MSDYYQENYKTYHEGTFPIDTSSLLEPFTGRLAKGSLILDVGCSSGRDLSWLKRRGFNVIGFERSKGLADLARKNVGCEVIEGYFETYHFSELSVDAILLSGTLVHVPHKKLPNVFYNIAQALGGQWENVSDSKSATQKIEPIVRAKKAVTTISIASPLSNISHQRYAYPQGYIYISLKEGRGEKNDSAGRTFYLWQSKDLRELFNTHEFKVLDVLRNTSALGTGEVWLSFILRKFGKNEGEK